MLLAIVWAAALVFEASADGAIAAPRQAQLLHMLKHDCGSCHGMTMKGGLGSSLMPEALAGKSDDELVAVILDGRPGTPMPRWHPLLTAAEATWLVRTLRRGEAGQ
ncbi:MAG: cytochrome c [Rhodospirillales bacterium]|nr:cytochrome c [Rhodospirillales bacterium]